MTTYNFLIPKNTAQCRTGFMAVLIYGMAVFAPLPAQAQEGVGQLPDSAVQQQVPQAFPDDPSRTPATPATPETQKTPSSALQERLRAAADQPAPGAAEQGASSQANAAEPPATAVPAQPEARKLVPATAMGTAAQNVQNGGAGQAEDIPNPVEDVAAGDSSGLPDGLEKYTARSEQVEDMQGAPEQSGDALPQIDDSSMVTLKGEGFENSNPSVTIPLEGLGKGKTSAQLQQEIRTEAYDAAITGMFPLSPDQIQTLLKRYDKTQNAAATPPYDAPQPEISVQNISLDPGMPPPVIKTAVGNVTTLNILDATGAPWPVQDVTWAGDYEIVEPEEGGHIVRITPMSHFARGNIVIRLLTLKTPLTMTLETGRDIVQYRVDARIPEYGPFANAPLMQGAKSSLVAGSPDLTSLLDGVMPGGMVKLEVTGVDGRTTAYTGGGVTYVRTPLTLLSPAWKSSVSSADGMNVYALGNAPVLLLSDGGEFQRATLKEKEDLLDE